MLNCLVGIAANDKYTAPLFCVVPHNIVGLFTDGFVQFGVALLIVDVLSINKSKEPFSSINDMPKYSINIT